jgi:hypothetical protein
MREKSTGSFIISIEKDYNLDKMNLLERVQYLH